MNHLKALQSENMPDGKDCQFMSITVVSETAETGVLLAPTEAGLPSGEVQDKVGGQRLALNRLR